MWKSGALNPSASWPSNPCRFFSSRHQHIAESGEINGGMEVKILYEAVLAQDLGGLKAGETVKLQGLSVYLFNNELISFIEDLT